MGNQNRISIELVVDDKGTVSINSFGENAVKRFKDVENAGQSLWNSWQGMATGFNQGIELFQKAMGVLGSIRDVARELAMAYGEQEIAETRLQAVLLAHGVNNVAVTKAYAELAAEIQNTTVYTDDQALSAMKIMTVMGTMPSQIKPATESVLMLASAFGMDLDNAAKLVGQAMEGNFTRIGRVIHVLKDVKKGTMDAADVFELLRNSIGDIAAREAETYIGKTKRLTNQYNELKESLGGYIAPTLSEWMDANIDRVHRLLGLFGETGLAWQKKELQIIDKEIEKLKKNGGSVGDVVIEGISVAGVEGENRLGTLMEARRKTIWEIESLELQSKKTLADADEAYNKAGTDLTMKKTEEERKAERDAERILDSLSKQNRTYYDTVIKTAQSAAEIKRALGQNELEVVQDLYTVEQNALTDWYLKETDIANRRIQAGALKEEKMHAIYMEYTKKWEENENKKELQSINYNKKRLDTESSLYKTIGEYSDEATAAEIAALGVKYTEAAKSTKNLGLLEKSRAADEKAIYDARNSAMAQGVVTLYGDINQYSAASHNAQLKLWMIQADKFSLLGRSEVEIMSWLAAQETKFHEGRASQAASFYGQLQAYAKIAYLNELEAISQRAEKFRAMGYDEVAVMTYVSLENRKAYIKMAENSKDWKEGVKAGLTDIQLTQVTWGKTMLETTKASYSSMAQASGDLFFDVVSRKLKTFDDYWNTIWTGAVKKFGSMAGEMATQKIFAYVEAKWTPGSKSALGVLDKLLGYAGVSSNLSDSVGDAYDTVRNWFTEDALEGGWAGGGIVPGVAKHAGDSALNDTVLARLSPDEYIEPRSAVNRQTLPMLEYIREWGCLPPGYAIGGLVKGINLQTPGYEQNWCQYYDSAGNVYVVPDIRQLGSNASYGIIDNAEMGTYAGGTPYNVNELVAALAAAQNTMALSTEVSALAGRSGISGALNNLSDTAYSTVSGGFSTLQDFWDAVGPQGRNILGSSTASQIAKSPYMAMLIKMGTTAMIAYAAGTIGAGLYKAQLAEMAAAEFAASGATSSYTASGALIYGSPEFFSIAGELGMTAGEAASLGGFSMMDVIGWMGKSVLKKALSGSFRSGSGSSAGSSGGLDAGSLGFTTTMSADGDYSALSDLGGVLGRYDFSAANGLDYVPFDGAIIQAHRGEAVLSEPKAEEYRAGESGSKIEINSPLIVIQGNLVADERTFNEFADRINDRLIKLAKWGH